MGSQERTEQDQRASLFDSENNLLYVSSIGRRTREKHVVKLRFISWSANSVCVLTSFKEPALMPDWLLNALASKGPTEIASKTLHGRITRTIILTNPEDSDAAKQVRDGFIKKYGARVFKETEYNRARPIILEFEVIRSRSDWLLHELEFDSRASSYTTHVLSNPVSRWQRQVTVSHLTKLFHRGETVLEVGCGSGIETVALASRGIKVVAVDVSEKMLRVVESRALESGVSDKIHTRRLSSSEIRDLESDPLFPEVGFDGVFSNFGVMNVEPRLAEFSKNLAPLLRSDGYASFAVFNRFCLSEAFAHLLKGERPSVNSRFSGIIRPDDKSRYSLDIFTYTPREFAKSFAREFDIVSWFALPTIIPPAQYVSKIRALMKAKIADLALGRLPLLSDIGDNFVMTLRRKSQIVPVG